MFRILIADDEVRLCRLIQKLIHWDDLDVELINFAHNGDDLLQMIIDEKPDIVISDIRMPGLSGLEVVQKCREHSDLPKFIMLTGYSEFEYAYTAIKNGVEDFLLKPVSGIELNAAIAKLTEGLAQRKTIDGYVNGQGITSDYILDMFSGNHTKRDPAILSGILEGRTLLPCLFCVDMKPNMGYYIDTVSKHIIKALRNNFITGSYELFIAHRIDGICILISDANDDMEKTLYLLEKTLDEIRENTISGGIVDITICIGLPIANTADISAAIQNVTYSKNARLCLGRNKLINSGAITWRNNYSFPKIESEEIIRALNNPDTQQLKSVISALMLQHKPSDDQAHNALLYCQLFISHVKRIVESQFAGNIATEDKYRHLYDVVLTCNSIRTVAEQVASHFAEQIDNVYQQNSKADSLIIQTVKEYIYAHCGEPLTLSDVGNAVYMSSSYLGTLFKQKTGMNFSAFLTQIRMEKAKSLLLNSNCTIAEIAHVTGYKDVRHFSKTFSQNVGIRPTEYRKYHYRPKASEEQ